MVRYALCSWHFIEMKEGRAKEIGDEGAGNVGKEVYPVAVAGGGTVFLKEFEETAHQ